MSIAEMIRTGDFKGEKHVPVIDAPAAVKAGEPFDVTVSVGKQVPHPNTTEHFIAWIDLYFKAEGEAFPFHLGHFDFRAHGESAKGPNQGPVYAQPRVTFSMQTAQPGTLIATSFCNIHGLWESSQELGLSG